MTQQGHVCDLPDSKGENREPALPYIPSVGLRWGGVMCVCVCIRKKCVVNFKSRRFHIKKYRFLVSLEKAKVLAPLGLQSHVVTIAEAGWYQPPRWGVPGLSTLTTPIRPTKRVNEEKA